MTAPTSSMNRPLRHVAIAALVMFAALLINSNVVQVGQASSLRANPHNVRVLYGEYSRARGPIVVGGKDIARSIKTKDALKYLRTYPGGKAYAPVTGYYSLVVGASGIEQTEDPILSGSDDRLFLHRLSDEITGRTPSGGSVVLTLNPAAQRAAYQGLKGVHGAVVAMDPSTGAILALATSPSYDPSVLSSHNSRSINRNYKRLLHADGNPLISRFVVDGEKRSSEAGGDTTFAADVKLADGQVIEGDGWSLEAVATPGHASNHMAFAWREKNILFAGDHVMGWSTSVVSPPDGSMIDYMASLEKLLTRDEDLYFCGHGPEVPDAKRYVRFLQRHRKAREDSILHRLAKGAADIPTIVRAIYIGIDPRLTGAAGLSVLAHMEDLVARDLVETDGLPAIDGVFRLKGA